MPTQVYGFAPHQRSSTSAPMSDKPGSSRQRDTIGSPDKVLSARTHLVLYNKLLEEFLRWNPYKPLLTVSNISDGSFLLKIAVDPLPPLTCLVTEQEWLKLIEKISASMYGNTPTSGNPLLLSTANVDSPVTLIEKSAPSPPAPQSFGLPTHSPTPQFSGLSPRTPTPRSLEFPARSATCCIERNTPLPTRHSSLKVRFHRTGVGYQYKVIHAIDGDVCGHPENSAESSETKTRKKKSRSYSNERICESIDHMIDENAALEPSSNTVHDSASVVPNSETCYENTTVFLETSLERYANSNEVDADVAFTWLMNMENGSRPQRESGLDSDPPLLSIQTWKQKQRRGDPVKLHPYVTRKYRSVTAAYPQNQDFAAKMNQNSLYEQLDGDRVLPVPLRAMKVRSYSYPPLSFPKYSFCLRSAKESPRDRSDEQFYIFSSSPHIPDPSSVGDVIADTCTETNAGTENTAEILDDLAVANGYSTNQLPNSVPSSDVVINGKPMVVTQSPISSRLRPLTRSKRVRPKAGRRTGDRVTAEDQTSSDDLSYLNKMLVNNHFEMGAELAVEPRVNDKKSPRSEVVVDTGNTSEMRARDPEGGTHISERGEDHEGDLHVGEAVVEPRVEKEGEQMELSDEGMRSETEMVLHSLEKNRTAAVSSNGSLTYRYRMWSQAYKLIRTCPFINTPESGQLPQFIRYPPRSTNEVKIIQRDGKSYAQLSGNYEVAVALPVKAPNARNWKEFLVGDLVWCKWRSDEYWPGTVYHITDTAPIQVTVFWTNDKTQSTVEYANVDSFDMAFHLRFDARRTDQKYLRAVTTALLYLGKLGFWEAFLTKKLYEEIVRQAGPSFCRHIGENELMELCNKQQLKTHKQTKELKKEEKVRRQKGEEMLQAMQASHFISLYDDSPLVSNAFSLTQRVVQDYLGSARYASRNHEPLFIRGTRPSFDDNHVFDIDPEIMGSNEIYHPDEYGLLHCLPRPQGSATGNGISRGTKRASKKKDICTKSEKKKKLPRMDPFSEMDALGVHCPVRTSSNKRSVVRSETKQAKFRRFS